MPNNTDGNKVSILAGQTPQTSEGRIAERIYSAVSKSKIETQNSLVDAVYAAERVQTAERILRIKFGYALEAVYELRCQLRPNPAGRQNSDPTNAGVGIRSVEKSKYIITDLVRFIIGDKLKPASLDACVDLLQLAEKEGIAPENFRRFMRNIGSIDVSMKIGIKSAKQPRSNAALLKQPANGR